jgi:hypothetical protein
MNFHIHPRDFFDFVGQSHKSQIVNLSQWKKYHREYIAKAGFLKQNGQLDNFQYDGYYWHGVPKHLQGIFELRLQSKFPTFDNSEPYPISFVQDIAQTYFKRSKFSSHLPHLPMLGFEEEEEEEEEDTDEEYDYSSSDEEYAKRQCRKLKAKKKKKKARTQSKSEPYTQIISEEPSRRIELPPEENDVGGLIQRLNQMSIDDPAYGHLFFQAVSQDRTGLAEKCIMCKPKQILFQPSNRDPPPHQYPSSQAYQPYPKGILPRQPGVQRPTRCIGCFETSHLLRDCPQMAQLLKRKAGPIDPKTLWYCVGRCAQTPYISFDFIFYSMGNVYI